MMAPFGEFFSLARPSQYLKPSSTLKQLNAFASQMGDNAAD
jgi:hypothetical protein